MELDQENGKSIPDGALKFMEGITCTDGTSGKRTAEFILKILNSK